MNKQIIEKAFEQAQKKFLEYLESEEFNRELFQEIIAQAEEEKRRTGKNPFDI